LRGRKRRENVDCQIHRFDDLPADMLHDSDGFRAASEGPLFSETPSCEAAKIFPRQQKIFNVCNKHAAQQLFLLHMQIIQLGTIWNEDYRETKKLHLEKTCKLMTGI